MLPGKSNLHSFSFALIWELIQCQLNCCLFHFSMIILLYYILVIIVVSGLIVGECSVWSRGLGSDLHLAGRGVYGRLDTGMCHMVRF